MQRRNERDVPWRRPVAWLFGVGLLAMVCAADPLARVLDTASAPAGSRLEASHVAKLQWRPVGPGIVSGRTVDLAVYEKDPDIMYAATAGGGVWKSTNNGISWTAVFEQGGSGSVGAIAVAADDPNIVWIGTGEAWNMRATLWGDGVYKTEDGGKTWQHMGLRGSQHVGRVLIDPRDHNTVYIAAMGALWGPNEERGLYKTTDGGKTWTRSLGISKYTGVVDVAMDPTDSKILYASAFQRERRTYSYVGGGPEAGLFKSVDGATTWQKLTNGLPTGDIGRIGVSVCRSQPATVYAAVRADEGGFFRSDDRGATWTRQTAAVQTHSGYGQVRCDPNNPDRVYALDNTSHVTQDGGKTFKDDLTPPGGAVHGDHHALWIDPRDSTHLVLGTDGGIYLSYDRGTTWDFADNVPVATFYALSADMQKPFYYIYAGAQDNGAWGGPSGTRYGDVTNADWFMTTGGDAFYAVIDPNEPSIVFTEAQYGTLVRFDTKTGENQQIQPEPPEGAAPYKWNWGAPLVMSAHDPKTLYFAANMVFKSTNRGDEWTAISPDLSRQLDPYQLPLQDKIQPRNAIDLRQSTAIYGNISAMAESPLRRGLLAAGTDDGLIQVTTDDGRTWAKHEKFPGVPERPKVTRIVLSRFEPQTIYATMTAYEDNDFLPYVVKSTDLGNTWTSISSDLPKFGAARVIAEDTKNRNLLFVGTEFGIFASNSGGDHWVSIKNNLPTAAVHDIFVHPREHDLIVGTHGRGAWILDDITALAELTPDTLAAPALLSQPRDGWQFHPFVRGRSSSGHRPFATPNPPEGVIINYYINPAAARGDLQLDILDEAGAVVRSLDVPPAMTAGIQRAVWDLRHALRYTPERLRRGRGPRGPFVMPGKYEVRLKVGDTELRKTFAVAGDPLTNISVADRRFWHDTLVALTYMQACGREVLGAAGALGDNLQKAVDAMKKAKVATLAAQMEKLRVEASAVALSMRQPPAPTGALRSSDQERKPTILEALDILFSSVEGWTGAPTAQQQQQIRQVHSGLTQQVDKVGAINSSLASINQQLKQRGLAPVEPRPVTLPPQAVPPAKSTT